MGDYSKETKYQSGYGPLFGPNWWSRTGLKEMNETGRLENKWGIASIGSHIWVHSKMGWSICGNFFKNGCININQTKLICYFAFRCPLANRVWFDPARLTRRSSAPRKTSGVPEKTRNPEGYHWYAQDQLFFNHRPRYVVARRQIRELGITHITC